MIAILAALEEEIRGIKKGLQIENSCSRQGMRGWQGRLGAKDCLLVLTGVGPKKARAAAEWVLDEFPVSLLISSGFAGALNGKSRAGDILLYTKLSQGEVGGANSANRAEVECDLALIQQSAASRLKGKSRVRKARGVTTSGVCPDTKSKIKLGQESRADAVDMESYWIGQAASARGIPFLAVRSVFDSLEDDVSFLEEISSDDKVTPGKSLHLCLRQPLKLMALARLYRHYRLAAANLALFLKEILPALADEGLK
jgi:adenosylhomocysteine nucleosidase